MVTQETLDKDYFEAIHEKRFAVFFRRGMKLIPLADHSGFLDWVQNKGLRLLGAEGFTYEKGSLTPLMDCIIDYSNGTDNGVEAHRKILSTEAVWQTADFVEFVIELAHANIRE